MRDIQAELRLVEELGQKNHDLNDAAVAGAGQERARWWAFIMFLAAAAFRILYRYWIDWQINTDFALRSLAWSLEIAIPICAILGALWYWSPGMRAKRSALPMSARIRELDREHFTLLVAQVGKPGNAASDFAVFACHMLGYFCFVPPNAMDWPSWKSALPVDVQWWEPPASTTVIATLEELLRSDFLRALPSPQRYGVLAVIRHNAQQALLRQDRRPIPDERAPTGDEVMQLAELMETAAERNEGPLLGCGALIRKNLQSSGMGNTARVE